MRSMVVIFGSLFLFVGCIVLWYGVTGLHYAIAKAPAADRLGDLGSAGLVTLVGLVLVLVPFRWARMADREEKQDDRTGD